MEKVSMQLTVLKNTEETLLKTAEAAGMTPGEVIDRMALNWQAKDPVYAAQLMLEEMIIHFHFLKKEEINSALGLVLSVLKECMDDLTPENIKKATECYFAK